MVIPMVTPHHHQAIHFTFRIKQSWNSEGWVVTVYEGGRDVFACEMRRVVSLRTVKSRPTPTRSLYRPFSLLGPFCGTSLIIHHHINYLWCAPRSRWSTSFTYHSSVTFGKPKCDKVEITVGISAPFQPFCSPLIILRIFPNTGMVPEMCLRYIMFTFRIFPVKSNDSKKSVLGYFMHFRLKINILRIFPKNLALSVYSIVP